MLGTLMVAIGLATAGAPHPCPVGTTPGAIRHSKVKPGQWATFEKAVAAHNGWNAAHGDGSRTTLIRVLTKGATGPALSDGEAVTIARYDLSSPKPERDAGYAAFLALYRDSSDVVTETRVCLPIGG